MRVFLCSFEGFLIAIPMDSVSSICIYNKVQHNEDNSDTYFSLPLLFNIQSEIRNGIVLKKTNANEDESAENKIILLSTKVEREEEIYDDEFFPIPKSLNKTRFSALFSGVLFAGQPVFLLNSGYFTGKANKEAGA